MHGDVEGGVVVETLAWLESDGRNTGTALPVTFAYVAADPWALRMLVRTPTVAVPWVFARELLADGLTRPAGEGDVLITPADDGIRIGLATPTGVAILKCGRGVIEKLLDQTERLVPLGEESAHVDWDRALAGLAVERGEW